MPKLIDKKETIAKVFALSGFFVDRLDYEFELISAIIHRCCEEIDKQPTIEPKVRRGRWIEVAKHKDENGTILTDYECSECFSLLKDSFPEQIEEERFCYNCGARMEGGADNG